jgi:hypothetical protein
VYQANCQFDRVIDALQKADPDVLYLTELTPDWQQAIAPLRSNWPHSIAALVMERISAPITDGFTWRLSGEEINALHNCMQGIKKLTRLGLLIIGFG